MNNTKYTFKRYEKKFILSPEKYQRFMKIAAEHFIPDEYHESTICSIYYDDKNYSLIRHSLEGTAFKEKIRLRSYSVPDENGTVFVELKKKYKGIVYKRRVELTERQAELWLGGQCIPPENGDIQTYKEINWFLQHNVVEPKAFIGVKRTSWIDKDNRELRVTFDRDICWRADHLRLTEGIFGEILLKDGKILMEIKIPDSSPIWLAHLLSDEGIFPETYSKYGTCYRNDLIKISPFAEHL